MAKQQVEPRILLDADVVIHFVKAGYQLQLTKIFPGRLVMLDKVKKELIRRKSAALGIENFLSWCNIPVVSIPNEKDILIEYAALIKTRGEGESACMAVAKFRKDYIASSNLSDIEDYCKAHSIVYYTTMDILAIAVHKQVMTEAEADNFIQEVINKGSKLPEGPIGQYLKTFKFKDKPI